EVGALVDHQRHVRPAGGLDAGRHPGGLESGRSGHPLVAHHRGACLLVQETAVIGAYLVGHGATPARLRPADSSSPRARFIDCTAPPAVPLVRLSSAAMATRRPARSSTTTCTCTMFEPSTAEVCGNRPSGSRCTNGSSA